MTSIRTATPNPRSWAFWRKRTGRALIVLALALTAAQILPALPEDQLVQLRPPRGHELTQATITYYSKKDGEPLSGSEIIPTGPAPLLTHSVRLPNDDYTITVLAAGADELGTPETLSVRQTISLTGSVAHVDLKPSKAQR